MQHPRRLLCAAILTAGLAGCSSAAAPAATPTGHGYVEGAVEATEPQLHLAAIDPDGALTLLDLIEGDSAVIAELGAVTAATTDGRFVFAARPGTLTVVDTGAWTVPHGDHSHYYLAEPRVVGTVEGSGTPEVVPGRSVTAVRFADETVLLSTAALGDGRLDETRTAQADLVASIGEETLVAVDGSVDGTACTDPAGSITTVVGTVIGCAEGVLLATEDGVELIPYPAAGRATSFESRAGRPTVAALVDGGVWLLDTRERSWTVLATEPLAQVVAVDDSAERIVARSTDGRVLTLDPVTGATLAGTEPLGTLGALTVDANRAYVAAPGLVYEIDYRDSVRIARTFELDAAFLAETGR